MNIPLEQLEQKQRQLMAALPVDVKILTNLNRQYAINLAYHSTVLSGKNVSLTDAENANDNWDKNSNRQLVETHNHILAWDYVRNLANRITTNQISQVEILHLHQILMQDVDKSAGQYRDGLTRDNPPQKVNVAMAKLVQWLNDEHLDHPVLVSANAHLKLIQIHPFMEANCRTARLLMNLILLQHGYPPAVILGESLDRYITNLEVATTDSPSDDYYQIIFEAVDASLDQFLAAIQTGGKEHKANLSNSAETTKTRPRKISKRLLKIGQLAKLTDQTVPTIRFWTSEGLIPIFRLSTGGYQLYQTSAVDRVKEIRRLQTEKRMSIKELKKHYKL